LAANLSNHFTQLRPAATRSGRTHGTCPRQDSNLRTSRVSGGRSTCLSYQDVAGSSYRSRLLATRLWPSAAQSLDPDEVDLRERLAGQIQSASFRIATGPSDVTPTHPQRVPGWSRTNALLGVDQPLFR
jgi:hypothetical protein